MKEYDIDLRKKSKKKDKEVAHDQVPIGWVSKQSKRETIVKI